MGYGVPIFCLDFSFNYHIATHDYYHLPFIPIVGLSLAPLGDWFFGRLREATAPALGAKSRVWVILIFGLFSVYGMFATR